MTNLITLISLFVQLIAEDRIFTSVYDDAQTFSVSRLTQILDLIVYPDATPFANQKAYNVMSVALNQRRTLLTPDKLVNAMTEASLLTIHDVSRIDQSNQFYDYEDLATLLGDSTKGLRAFAYNYVYSAGKDSRPDPDWDIEMYTIPYIVLNIFSSLMGVDVTEAVNRINYFTQPYADRSSHKSIVADHSYANVTTRVMILLEVLASWCVL